MPFYRGTRLPLLSRRATAVASTTPLLDTYSAAAAYSTRKLRTGQTNALRLRRSSDSAESDFGFSGDDLDTAAISTWLGSADGFVVTWYDQSGNAQNATQATASSQPQIATAGTVDADRLKFSSSDHLVLPKATYLNNQSHFFIFSVSKPTGAGGSVPTVYTSYTDNGYKAALVYDFTTVQRFEVGGRRNKDDSFLSIVDDGDILNATALVSGHLNYSSGTAKIWANGALGGTNSSFHSGTMNSSTHATSNDNLGGLTASVEFIGYLKEIIVYASDQSTNRTAIESNINTYWSIY